MGSDKAEMEKESTELLVPSLGSLFGPINSPYVNDRHNVDNRRCSCPAAAPYKPPP